MSLLSEPSKIAVVTGTRAEYGLLSPLMEKLRDSGEFILQTIVTGAHLSPQFGLTYQEIELDGFHIDARIDMLLSSDTPVGICKSMGVAAIGFADALERLKPDWLIVLGDRYEIIVAAQTALVFNIPIVHIAGGDITEGAIDNSIRHAITKMSHLHFVTHETAACKVRQMGENPDNVFVVGSPAIDQIQNLTFLSREQLEQSLSFRFQTHNLLVTFHPATLEAVHPEQQMKELLLALDMLGGDTGIIFTLPNADTRGRALIAMTENYVQNHPHAILVPSLGQQRYFSVIREVDAVVGNSSSGIYEVPSFQKPTINIGSRQRGRPQAASVLNCEPGVQQIYETICKAYQMDCSGVVNPYGDGQAVERMMQILQRIRINQPVLQKKFYEVNLV